MEERRWSEDEEGQKERKDQKGLQGQRGDNWLKNEEKQTEKEISPKTKHVSLNGNNEGKKERKTGGSHCEK